MNRYAQRGFGEASVTHGIIEIVSFKVALFKVAFVFQSDDGPESGRGRVEGEQSVPCASWGRMLVVRFKDCQDVAVEACVFHGCALQRLGPIF